MQSFNSMDAQTLIDFGGVVVGVGPFLGWMLLVFFTFCKIYAGSGEDFAGVAVFVGLSSYVLIMSGLGCLLDRRQ